MKPAVDRGAAYAATDRLRTSTITCFELLGGAKEGKPADQIQRLLAAIPVLPLDRVAAEYAATVRRDLDAIGQAIGLGDSLIAGIALANRLPLFTRPRRHFERIGGLQMVEEETVSL